MVGGIAVFAKLTAAGKHVSPADRQFVAALKQKLGIK